MRKSRRESGCRIALLALPLVFGASIAHTAPPPPDRGIQLLESSARSIRFRVRFPAPIWRTEESATGSGNYPFWPGLQTLARPGDPQVGARIVRVAVPPQGAITVEETPDGGGRAESVRFPPAPGPEPRDPRVPARAPRGAKLPATHAEILAVGLERGLRIATIAIRPARRGGGAADGGKGGDEIQWADEVEVGLHVDGTEPARTRAPRPDPVQEPLWRETLLNPESVPAFLAQPAASSALPNAWFDDAGGWLKIQITINGVYTLSHDALAAAGVPVGAIDPRTLRLFSGPLVPDLPWTTLGWDTLIAGTDTSVVDGWDSVSERPGFTAGFGEAGGFEEIAIWVDGEEDGAFGASDRVVFYALGPDNYRDRFGLAPGAEEYFENPYTDRTVYWLAWEGGFPGSPRRMAGVGVAPPQGATPATDAQDRVHAERNTIYVPSLSEPGLRTETWFWDILSTQSQGKRFPVNLPSAVPGDSISAHIRVWGGNIPGPDTPLHQVQLDVNGVSAGLYQWGGDTPYAALTPQDMRVSGIPVAQPSNFDFRVPSLVLGRDDQSYLAWIDVIYRRSLALGGQPGEVPADGGVPGRVVRVSQVPSGTLDVFDVTDFRGPRRLTGFTPVVTVTGPGIELALDDPGNRHLAVASRSAPKSPAALILDDPPATFGAATWLRDSSEPMDYVIVAHDAFLQEAETLADRRRQSLYGVTPGRAGRARAVRVSDVMDEFAWGMWDPTALRYFLEYAYRYCGGPGADPLAYCLFLGDHTYDFRHHLGTGTVDLVPSWEENREDLGYIDFGSVQYASDDPLARFDGPRDPYLDLAIGRIPVSTPEAARAVIEDKILRSETDPHYGSWRARVLIAADDLCQGGQPDAVSPAFLEVAEELDGLLPPEYDRSKIYLTEYGTSCSILSKPQAAVDFKAAWNDGAWLVNYVGHGDEGFLADERILTLPGVTELTNLDRLPLFIATASKSAKYNLPGQSSITEAIAVSAAGGALAATGSVSNQTFPAAAFTLNQEFVKRLFETDPACLCPANPRPAGLAFAAAKRSIPAEAAKYVFLGDPASVPPAPVLLPLVLAGPDSLTRGGLAPVRARLANPALLNGTLDLRAEDATRAASGGALPYRLPGDLMFRGETAFTADSASAAFVVPLAAREGPDARIRGYAHGVDWDAVSALRGVTIRGQVDPSTDTAGPFMEFDAHAPQVVVGQSLTVVLEDPSGIRLFVPGGTALELVAHDAQNTEMARLPVTDLFAYDAGSYTRGRVTFPVPDLENGPYRFTVAAFDNFGNPATAVTDVEITTGGTGISFQDVYAYPNPLDAETDVVFTLNGSIEVSIRIFSVSGRTVRKESIQADAGRNDWRWDGRDQAGDPVANGVYLLKLATKGSGGEDPAQHLERLVVLR